MSKQFNISLNIDAATEGNAFAATQDSADDVVNATVRQLLSLSYTTVPERPAIFALQLTVTTEGVWVNGGSGPPFLTRCTHADVLDNTEWVRYTNAIIVYNKSSSITVELQMNMFGGWPVGVRPGGVFMMFAPTPESWDKFDFIAYTVSGTADIDVYISARR